MREIKREKIKRAYLHARQSANIRRIPEETLSRTQHDKAITSLFTSRSKLSITARRAQRITSESEHLREMPT